MKVFNFVSIAFLFGLILLSCSDKSNINVGPPIEEEDPLLIKIKQVLFEGKPAEEFGFVNFELYDLNGQLVNTEEQVSLRSEEPLLITFSKQKEFTVNCCSLDVLGWNQYDETQYLILGYEVEHSSPSPESVYFREHTLRPVVNGVIGEPTLPGLDLHFNAFETDCEDDYVRFYGWAIPPSWLSIGTYNYRGAIGFEVPGNSQTCAEDDKNVYFGWPF